MHNCLIPDDSGNCIECGRHIDLPEINGPLPDLGDIVGICRLIDSTALDFRKALREDPIQNPSVPRLRLIAVIQRLQVSSYAKAKALGYRSTYERWIELVWDRTPAVEPPFPH